MSGVINCGTVRFVGIPEYFLERYAEEIDAWARNVRKVGLVKRIILKEGRFAEMSPDPALGPVLIQVMLRCKPWSGGVEILPLTERDGAAIMRHVEKMEGAGWPARLFDKELDRAWLPFTPVVQ